MADLIQTITIYALPLVLAITMREAAHAYAAKYFGDMTGFSQGRVTLNPMNHIDLVGTIVIPLVLFAISNGSMLFGYPKQVPVNYANLRHPKRDMAWVAFAGPLANFAMAFLWLLLAELLKKFNVQEDFFILVANAGVITNLFLMAFNLIPIPPFDGGRMLISALPLKAAIQFSKIEPYGFYIVLALAFAKLLMYWIGPIIYFSETLLRLMIFPIIYFF